MSNETLMVCQVIFKKDYSDTIIAIRWKGTGTLEKCEDQFNLTITGTVLGQTNSIKLSVNGNASGEETVSGITFRYEISEWNLSAQSISFRIKIDVNFVGWRNLIDDRIVAPIPASNSFQELCKTLLENAKEIDALYGLANLEGEESFNTISAEASILSPEFGSQNQIVSGAIEADGSIIHGNGFSIRKFKDGAYYIRFDQAFRELTATVTAYGLPGQTIGKYFGVICAANELFVHASNSERYIDTAFTFIAVGKL